MQKFLKVSFAAAIALVFVACGSGTKDMKGELGDKKVELEKLKKEQDGLLAKITKLEKDIAVLDPSSAVKPKLVGVGIISADSFAHYIDLQGKIDAKNVANVAPRNGGGTVKAIYVSRGQNVAKGQLLAKLDDAIPRQQLAAAQQAIAGVEAQLRLAQSVYERQQNLWKQNIGSEVQVLQAKTNSETVASQLNGAKANVKLAQESVSLTNVIAEISGTIDMLNLRVGEAFIGNNQITIVNTSDLRIMTDVPEKYLDKVGVGSIIKVVLPENANKTFTAKVTVAGKLINPDSRSFYIEAKIPSSKEYRPNQIALVKIRDYAVAKTITIPINTLQNDEKGKYVMLAVKEGNKLIAQKRKVEVGDFYGDKLEVKSGLQEGDQLVTEGFQNLYDGQQITTTLQ